MTEEQAAATVQGTAGGLTALQRLLEAAIFAAKAPMPEHALHAMAASLAEAGGDVCAALAGLRLFYQGRGINLVETGGAWSFRTAPDLAAGLGALRVETRRLSRAQVETLAIIAYHQPITRAEIEEIRGVSLHKGTLDLLMEAGWIVPKGRRQSPGRPVTWITDAGFLHHFGLRSLDDLPNLADLRAAGLLDTRVMMRMGEDPMGDPEIMADLSDDGVDR